MDPLVCMYIRKRNELFVLLIMCEGNSNKNGLQVILELKLEDE